MLNRARRSIEWQRTSVSACHDARSSSDKSVASYQGERDAYARTKSNSHATGAWIFVRGFVPYVGVGRRRRKKRGTQGKPAEDGVARSVNGARAVAIGRRGAAGKAGRRTGDQ